MHLVDVLEAARDAARLVLHGGEELQEHVRLVALHLAVLHRPAAERLVKLDCLERGNTCLVCGALLAQPEEDIPNERRALRLRACLEHDVSVALEEVAVKLGFHQRRHQLLDAPDLKAGLCASAVEIAAH